MKIGSPIPRRRARLEIIPLIDIMFFLLAAFMMVSLTMIKMQSIKVTLPPATQSQSDLKPDILNITVSKAGEVYLEKKHYSKTELQEELLKRHRANPNLPVYVSGDEAALHGEVTEVLDLVRKTGIEKVAIAIRTPKGAK